MNTRRKETAPVVPDMVDDLDLDLGPTFGAIERERRTKRRHEAIRLLALGLAAREVAIRLGCDHSTVRKWRKMHADGQDLTIRCAPGRVKGSTFVRVRGKGKGAFGKT